MTSRKDAYYFPHDANARSDERVMYLRAKYGLAAYAIYFMIVEIMHEQMDGKLHCSLLEGLCQQLNVDKTLLNDFYDDAIGCGLFQTDGKKYWSERVLRNKEHLNNIRRKRSDAGKAGATQRWGGNGKCLTNASQTHGKAIAKNSKGKERKEKKTYSDEFLEFWREYPRKEAKKTAFDSWLSLSPDKKTIEEMHSGLSRYKKTEQWGRSGGKYIPHCSVFINQRRWEDELTESTGSDWS